MALNKMDIVDVNLNTGNIHRTFLNHSIGSGDNNANAFGVRLFRDNEPVNIGSGWVQGFFRNSHGENIALTQHGVIDGNEAYVTLPQACYNYDGQFTLAIKIVSPGSANTVTMRIVDGIVDNTNTGSAVAPTGTVPTYQEVLAAYEQAVTVIDKSVRFDTTQSLTDTQKATARTNIGAASVGTANELAMDIGALAEGFANESYMDLGNKYMPFRRGYYSTPAVGSTSSYQSNSQYFYALVMCQPGDILHAHCYGNSTVYAWAFLDSNLKVLSRGGTGNFEGTQTAPASTSYVLVNVDISHMSTGFYAWVGEAATGDQISDLKSALDAVIAIPGDNIVALSDFTDGSNSSKSVDDENNTITISTTSKGTYRYYQTAATFIPSNLIVGKTYRLHAKANKISGSPTIVVAIRGTSSNADAIAEAITLNGTGDDGFVDFVADSYMKRVSLFVTMNTSASASVMFSEIWLKEYNPTSKITDDTLLTSENTFVDTTFPMAIFRGNSTITTADNAGDGYGAIIRRAQFQEAFEIYADTGYHLTVMKNDGNNVRKYYNQTEMFFDAGQLFSIAFLKDDDSLVTLDDLTHLHLRCSQQLKDQLDQTYKYTFSSGTLVFNTPSGIYDTPIGRGSFNTTTKLPNRTPSYSRATVEVIAEKSFAVMSGYNSTNHPGVVVNKINDDNTITSVDVPELTRNVFTAGRYIFSYYSSNTSANTNINSYVVIEAIESGTTPSGNASQIMTPGDQRGQGFMFDDDYNIWILKNHVDGENSKMYVRKQNNTYSDMITLGMDVGHGNNITNFDGKVWISDWYLPKIYRFTIDSDEFTATYVDTIEMPTDGITGSIEYVPISDNEIIAATWSDSNRETLEIIRYVKTRTTGEYIEQERFPVSVHEYILQGFGYYDGYLYLLMDNSNNVNQGIQVINMKTHNSVFISSDYQTESESIMSIKYNELMNLVNVIIGYEQGTVYRLTFDKKYLPN